MNTLNNIMNSFESGDLVDLIEALEDLYPEQDSFPWLEEYADISYDDLFW